VRIEINRYKDNSLYLSPTTKKLHDNLEKASKNTQPLYATRKFIIHSIDHILNHDLVCEDPLAAKFVSDMEREMQVIEERFNAQILSLLGSRTGQNNELCFPSINNKKRKVVEKRFKGYTG
jgi:hypothetical protein